MGHTVFNIYTNRPPSVVEYNKEPTMTQQHFTEECDINQILKKFIQTGTLDSIGPGVYADLGDSVDYHTSMNIIANANQMFADLPSNIRARFNNNPAEYMDFVHDPANLAEGQKLGIFTQNATFTNREQQEGANPSGAPENTNAQ